MMNIIFDMDGTLIDSKLRLYQLFQDLVPSSRLSFEQYWSFKKNKISNEMILANQLGFEKDAIDCFLKNWMCLIETPPYLELDTNFNGMHDTLSRLIGQAELHVCTARQLIQPVLDQLQHFDLLHFFNKILVTEQQISKEQLIGKQIPNLNDHDWILGDTGKDIQVGKSLNLKTCAVLSGFLNCEMLSAYEPDIIINSAVHFSL